MLSRRGTPHAHHTLRLLYHLLIDTYTGSINQGCEQGALNMDVQASLCCVDSEFSRYIHRRSSAELPYNRASPTQKVECVFSLIVSPTVYTNA